MKESLKVDALRGTALFRGLDNADIAAAIRAAGAFETDYAKGDIVWDQDSAVQNAAIVKAGILLCMRYAASGHNQLLHAYSAGATVNVEAVASRKGISPTNAAMSTDGTIIWIPYRELVDGPGLRKAVQASIKENAAYYLADEAIRGMKKNCILSRHTTQDRILAFFNNMREKSHDDTFDIEMGHPELASYLCVDRTTLTQALNTMRKNGLIGYRGTVYTILHPLPKRPDGIGELTI
ncbi:MAG: Crp/Fnr family transcriptional regulator [Clostridiales Family XIII bacterium]|nr:Crp/Fnr family transcriptional regulator [Clostridiales Family XIII bacterium]